LSPPFSHFFRSQGYLLIGSGMICHSFELAKAAEADKAAVSVRLLAESKRFDAATKRATTIKGAEERKKALLALEEVPEFVINHPTVEVRCPFSLSSSFPPFSPPFISPYLPVCPSSPPTELHHLYSTSPPSSSSLPPLETLTLRFSEKKRSREDNRRPTSVSCP
jgi:hypothetical protein